MNKEIQLANAQEMYNKYRFGSFSYGVKRKCSPLLIETLKKTMKTGSTLYDIGCGTGYWFSMYLNCGFEKKQIHGIDISERNVEELKEKGFNVYQDNAMNLTLQSNISDCTVSNGVIHHTPDPDQAFKELLRITKPQGLIFISVYNKFNPYYYLIHKATFPLRYIYWNWTKRIADLFFPLFTFCIFQPMSYITMQKFLDRKSAYILYMDQVMTPRADLFSKREIKKMARESGSKVVKFQYHKCYLMISAIIKKRIKIEEYRP